MEDGVKPAYTAFKERDMPENKAVVITKLLGTLSI
jgi:hypothetical protein